MKQAAEAFSENAIIQDLRNAYPNASVLSRKQAAAAIGVSRSTIEAMIRNGIAPKYTRVGVGRGRVVFTIAAIAEYLNERTIGGGR